MDERVMPQEDKYYWFRSRVGGWRIVGVYYFGGKAVLTFNGTDEDMDWSSDMRLVGPIKEPTHE